MLIKAIIISIYHTFPFFKYQSTCAGDGLLIESDSDDEPEDIGFVASRASSLQHVKDVMLQIGKTKQQKKEKRKHLDDKFREQKVRFTVLN